MEEKRRAERERGEGQIREEEEERSIEGRRGERNSVSTKVGQINSISVIA